MKTFISSVATRITQGLMMLLRNRNEFNLSREELRFFRPSFSQFGEDIIINNFFETVGPENGTYLDIGAYHPIHFSNTLLLYRKGWSGVNIDINESKIKTFDIYRTRDTNIAAAIGNPDETYVLRHEGELKERLVPADKTSSLNQDTVVHAQTIKQCLERASRDPSSIDYVNIDCEGHDLDVLKQIDLDTMSPKLISVEALGQGEADEICEYLTERGYLLSDKLHWTFIFVRADVGIHSPTLN